MNQVFDSKRAILFDEPDTPPFSVQHYLPLTTALEQEKVYPQDHCLIAVVNDAIIVLPTLAMVYHHVAQGQFGDLHWMVAFCSLCNAGSVFDATYEDKVYHFAAQGYYETMVLIADQQTQSYWNHLTGTCLHGELAGATLSRLSSLLQMRAADALAAYPQAQFGLIETLSAEEIALAERWNIVYRLPENPDYGAELLGTATTEDNRLARYDMGLGLWTAHTRRYYPILKLYENNKPIIDKVDGRTVIITLDPDIGLPMAFYYETDHAETAYERITLGEHVSYHKGVLYVGNQPVKAERPNHNAIRWFAFSSLFPGCEIYGVE